MGSGASWTSSGASERLHIGQGYQREVIQPNLKLSQAATFEESSKHARPPRLAALTGGCRLNTWQIEINRAHQEQTSLNLEP